MTNRPIWFKAKTYGWGWYPSTWQGWAVIAVYILVVSLIFNFFDNNASANREDSLIIFGLFLLSTIALVTISYLFGEKPGWRWGEKII